MRLLLVEDDRMIGESLQKVLKPSYIVNWVQNAEDAQASLETENYDLILLDLGLPQQSGIAFLINLRKQQKSVPVLIVTARDTTEDKILGLDVGADDYLVKPFDVNELQARIRVLMRRQSGRAESIIVHGVMTLNPATYTLTVREKTETLSSRPFLLIQALLEKPGSILSRAQLEERIYGWNEEVESNSVEVHIHALRRRFGADIIKNIRGVGYTIGSLAA